MNILYIYVRYEALYVDDTRTRTTALRKGMRWDHEEKKFVHRLEWQEEDDFKGESNTRRSAIEMRYAMNSIFPGIEFTIELEEDFPNRRLPTLDCEVWTRPDQMLDFSFYEKPMNSKYCILDRSAMAEKSKISILSNELVRRMSKTSTEVSQQERANIIEEFIAKLKVSGYKRNKIKEIVVSGLSGYKTKLAKAEKEGRHLHRSARATLAGRHSRKLLEKTSWYKPKGKAGEEREIYHGQGNTRNGKRRTENGNKMKEKKEIRSVLFVPRTRGGNLANMIREKEYQLEELTGYRIKVVEKSGMMILRTLQQKNPWGSEDCNREDCLLCESKMGEEGQGKSCKKRNLVYETTCNQCKQEGRVVRYLGETARSAFERGREHNKAYMNLALDSHMLKHKILFHRGEEKEVKFNMKVLQFHQSSFDRQIHEAVAIEMAKERGEILCNSKGEYNRCVLPRLTALNGSSKSNEGSNQLSEEEIEKVIQQLRKEARKRRRCKEEEGEGENWEDTGGVQTKPRKRQKLCKEGEIRMKRSTRVSEHQPQAKRKKIQNRAELRTAQELIKGNTEAELNKGPAAQPQPMRKKIPKRAELSTSQKLQKQVKAELNRKRCVEKCDTLGEDIIPALQLQLSASHSLANMKLRVDRKVSREVVQCVEVPGSQSNIEEKASQESTLSVSQSVQQRPRSKNTILELWKKREKKDEEEKEETRKKVARTQKEEENIPRLAEKQNQIPCEEKPGVARTNFNLKKTIPKTKLVVKEIVNNFEENIQPRETFKSKFNFKENLPKSKEENARINKKIFPIFLAGQISKVQEKVVPSSSRKKLRKPEKKAYPSYGSIREHLIPQIKTSNRSTGTSSGIKIKNGSDNKLKAIRTPQEGAKFSQDSN